MDTVVLAEKLGRSYQAVANIRWRMGHTDRKELGDYDDRPSGWYVEIIGKLLMEYEDAFNTWKHYFRYTEIKVMGENSPGWVMLLCKRDADAP